MRKSKKKKAKMSSMKKRNNPKYIAMAFKDVIKEKVWPFLAGLGSATVMVLAFFIPSLQDQWDRYQSRKIIEQYVTLGNEFYNEDRYDMAEEAYLRAFELSDSRRLDIEVKRLNARINRINISPEWGTALPEDVTETDFQYVLHLQKDKGQQKERINTLNSYGIFLAASGKRKEAENVFTEAMHLDSTDARAYINLGNLYDQQGKKEAALEKYRQGIVLDPANARAHYNLGLLYAEQGRKEEAKVEFRSAMKYDPSDTDAPRQYKLLEEQ
jgi:tetratricopeptide (TPR) repeat protein